MQQRTDEELMKKVVAGDFDAFAALVDRYMRAVVSLAEDLTRAAPDADEIAQEIFLEVWERPQRFDSDEAPFSTWLHRVTVNHCINRRLAQNFDPLDDLPPLATNDTPLLELLRAVRYRAALKDVLLMLPIRQRAALALFYMHQLSKHQAAWIMDISEGAFESLLQRARGALGPALCALQPGLAQGA